ncbi:MAG TPA: hypothetical protein VMY34_11450, partial [Acidimicrobiales bacterium]|nr:hypothetical protein [Acidimicrobiales bacterium]
DRHQDRRPPGARQALAVSSDHLFRDGLEVAFVVAVGGMLFSALAALRRGEIRPTICRACGRPTSRAYPRCRHCRGDR